MKTAKQFGRRGLPPADAGAPGAGARKRSFGVPMAATGALLTVGLVGGVLALAPGGSQPRNVAAGTAGTAGTASVSAQCDPKAGESCSRSRVLPSIIYIPGGSGSSPASATARGGFGATGASVSTTSASG